MEYDKKIVVTYSSKSNIDVAFERHYPRFLERYRRCRWCKDDVVFHSTYYRIPDKKIPTVTTVHDFTYEKYASFLTKSLSRIALFFLP